MRQKRIEQKLLTTVKKMGGISPKFVSPGLDGMPDRLVLLPGGRLAFVERVAPLPLFLFDYTRITCSILFYFWYNHYCEVIHYEKTRSLFNSTGSF